MFKLTKCAKCVASLQFLTAVNVWELRKPAAGPLGEECCPISARRRILAAQQFWDIVFFKCFQLVRPPGVFCEALLL